MLAAVLTAGAAYGVIGLVFGAAASGAASTEERFRWRLAAWIVSGAVFAAHILYVHLRSRREHSAGRTALMASAGAALGAFWLAVAATVHALQIGATNLGAFRLALVVWPAATAVPAFLAALVAAAGLAVLRRRA